MAVATTDQADINVDRRYAVQFIILRPCAEPRCPNLVDSGYCETHRRPRNRALSSSLYQTVRWRHIKRNVLRAKPLCDCGMLTTDVDHRVPVEDGGPMWDYSNLQALCRSCHSRKTQRDMRRREY